ncbi:MAG: hypothetical protein KF905_12210 [Flavobacteriales bacterium]|nr:hypothetical protein [Flavobacteriales bacterium]
MLRRLSPLICCLLHAAVAGAQQYDIRNFSLEEGLPSAVLHGLCEDHDGFLWVATDEGAARSEGLAFETIGRRQGLPSDEVTAIFCDRQGRVWMGNRKGQVAMWQDGSVTVLPSVPGMAKAQVRAFTQDSNDAIWWATDGQGLIHYNNGTFERHGRPQGLPSYAAFALAQDRFGHLLAGTDSGLYRHANGRWQPCDLEHLGNVRINALFADERGVLVGTSRGYLELDSNLVPLPPAERFTASFPISLPDPRVLSVARARNGDLWLGTPAGLVHLHYRSGQPAMKLITEANGLGHDLVRAVMQDRSGAIWAGTGFGGASKFMSDAFTHFTDRDGLRSRIVSAIHRTPDGYLWMATLGGGLARWDGRSLSTFGKEHGLDDPYVLALGEDEQGYLLVGTASNGLYRLHGKTFVEEGSRRGLRPVRINAIHRDTHGKVWLATDKGIHRATQGGPFQSIGPNNLRMNALTVVHDTVWAASDAGLYFGHGDGTQLLPSPLLGNVLLTALAYDSGANLWIGSEGHGLYRLNGTRLDSIQPGDGLSSSAVEQVLLDAYENIWLGTRRGIDMLELDVLQERVLSIRHHGSDEGFIGIENFRNAAFLDVDSTLWFGTVRGATRYDPRLVLSDEREPLVHLTDLRLFFERPDWLPWCSAIGRGGIPQDLVLPHNKNHLTFTYTGVSLAYPERVRYRYILEGYDPDWSPITALDRITYSNIPPGEYTFKVMARNGSGIWTEAPITYSFRVAPPFWRTMPFQLGSGAFLLLGLGGFIRMRERSLRKDRERLERMVATRTRELATEKDRSERLLLNILPASTADELMRKGAAEAKRHNNCSVLFSDFTGFTGYSSLMDSSTVVAELDHFFRLFDRICDKYGVEKIKTIGDAYMCASGLPEPKASHALDLVLMALEMIDAVERTNTERRAKGLQEWHVRIGMHSGPVVSGVVGEKKFAYDIWGDTVNLASRMESNGQPGHLNVSGSTYAQIMDFVEARPRGPIKVKGKGEVQMYFVERLRPAYAADADGRIPNEALLELRRGM